MKALAITNRGIEDITALEIKEILNSNFKVEKGCVIFDFKTYDDLALLAYKSQSIKRIIILLKQIKNIEEINKIDFYNFTNKKTTFRVSSEIIDNDISSENLNADAGEIIINKIKKEKGYKQKVNLEEPDIIFFIYTIKNTYYFGIDFSGDLAKRDYKIFTHPKALKGNIAYALVRISGFNKENVLVDPFSTSEIPIEAALFTSGLSCHYYNKEKFSFLKLNLKIDFKKISETADKKTAKSKAKIYSLSPNFRDIKASKSNAKIAGVNKTIKFSRMETEWLDTKFKKNEVDYIVSKPVESSKNKNQKAVEKTYDELFHNADFVLKKQGKIVLLVRNEKLLKQKALKHSFKLTEQRDIWSGKEKLQIIVFSKS